jgi:hypothetical protein
VRNVPALIATAGLVLATLTACSPGSAAADCTAPVSSGDASDLVSVTGDFGSVPSVDFPTPLKTDDTQRSEIIEGSGPGLVEGQQAQLELSIFDAATGEVIQASAYDAESTRTFPIVPDQLGTALAEGLLCAQVGSRLTVVTPPGLENSGVNTADSVVFVVDVVKAYLTRADGAAQLPVAGLPAVVLAEDGTPGITVPAGEPPTELEVGVLKKGDGAEVTQGSQAMIHFTGLTWEDESVFGSTWADGTPGPVLVDENAAEGGLPGLSQALIGQTVGSQIVAVIPPELAYGEAGTAQIPPNSTVVVVVDILGVD